MSFGISYYIRSMRTVRIQCESDAKQKLTSFHYIQNTESALMPTDACRGNSTVPLHKGSEVEKIWNSPLIRRKEADTKNTIFHYKINGNQSVYYIPGLW